MSSLTTLTNYEDHSTPEEYVAILQRLLKQRAINIDLDLPNPEECTLEQLQDIVEYIFNGRLDAMIYQMAHKEILKNEQLQSQSKLLLKKLSPFQVMNFPQVILYKTLPCPRGENCKSKPREIAPSNQYKDEELECPFYHHDKDRRRLPITRKVEEEFIYKANYDKSKCDPFPDKFSKNYFESMFHPIYYRLFQCKRTHCENSFFCPFFHTKDEKTTWDETFLTFIRKSRDVYTKEKKEKPQSSPKNKDEFLAKFEIVALDRRNSPLLPTSQITFDRVSTRSSTNSSPSSHNEFSPDPERKLNEDMPLFHSPMNFNNFNKGAHNPPGIQMHTTFSLFGDYSKIFTDSNEGDSKPTSNTANPLNQFFNWSMIQNINNVKLNH